MQQQRCRGRQQCRPSLLPGAALRPAVPWQWHLAQQQRHHCTARLARDSWSPARRQVWGLLLAVPLNKSRHSPALVAELQRTARAWTGNGQSAHDQVMSFGDGGQLVLNKLSHITSNSTQIMRASCAHLQLKAARPRLAPAPLPGATGCSDSATAPQPDGAAADT